MNHQPAIIFDFDGTLADSFPVAIDIFYRLTHRQPLAKADVSRLRGLTLRQVAKELKIPLWYVPTLMVRGRKAMHASMDTIMLVDGIEEAVRELAKTHKLFILSSNSKPNITKLLDRYDLNQEFSEIYGDVSLLRKASRIKQILKQNQLDRAHTIYIGDEARDIEAARDAGIAAVAVSWGYNNIKILKQHMPSALVFNSDELLRSIYNHKQNETAKPAA